MDEHLVVARHAAADLLAVEIDGDDVVDGHLVEPDGGRLHQEAARVIGQPHGHVTGDEVALVLAGEDAARIGELSPERLGHRGILLACLFVLPRLAEFTSLSARTCEAGDHRRPWTQLYQGRPCRRAPHWLWRPRSCRRRPGRWPRSPHTKGPTGWSG